MTLSHEAVQEALLARDDGEALEAPVAAHLDDCAKCAALAEALGLVDEGLAALPPLEPPPALIAQTLERVRAEARPSAEEASPAPDVGVLGLLAATFGGLLSGLWSIVRLLFAPLTNKKVRRGLVVAVPALGALALFFAGSTFLIQGSEDTLTLDDAVAEERTVQFVASDDDEGVAPSANQRAFEQGLDTSAARPEIDVFEDGWVEDEETEIPRAIDAPTADPTASTEGIADEITNGIDERNREISGLRFEARLEEARREPPSETSRQLARLGYLDRGEARDRTADGTVVAQDGELDLRSAPANAEGQGQRRSSRATGSEASPSSQTVVVHTPPADVLVDGRFREGDRAQMVTLLPAEQGDLGGLVFQPAHGYWANTYLPGDPAIRTLRRRLADHPAAERLAELAGPADPHLDPPREGALALRLAADRSRVEGRSRVLLSVALRGAAQRAGRRPTLRTQVVLDLRRPLDDDGRARVRSLLTELSRSRDGADRTGVIIAGPRGGELLPLGRLRFGEVSVALRRAFDASGEAHGEAMDLPTAIERAVTSIGQLEDDASPLGSSLVLLVSPSLSDADARGIARVAHTGTLAGVTTTAVGLGDAGSLEALERVALAGHGRRRVLSSPGEARGLVRAETTAISRVVARAVRLRIRLAEGAQLVNVLGSHRLDDAAAQRVRASEQAIDRALARRLGITSDRGEDEDGIQIVIPAFYADDAHVVLLDVVVPGPGPVADVQVRFKDLLRLGNGTLTDRLQLGRGASSPGPQERAVLAERLGFELASSLRAAARFASRGETLEARQVVLGARERLLGARRAVPELASQPALARDTNLCDRFASALAGGAIAPDGMSGALRYAAHRRLFGDPLDLGGSD